MRDSYFYKSLISTLILYITALSIVVGFIFVTGVVGISVIFVIIAGALCYFYGMFEKSENMEKGEKKV